MVLARQYKLWKPLGGSAGETGVVDKCLLGKFGRIIGIRGPQMMFKKGMKHTPSSRYSEASQRSDETRRALHYCDWSQDSEIAFGSALLLRNCFVG